MNRLSGKNKIEVLTEVFDNRNRGGRVIGVRLKGWVSSVIWAFLFGLSSAVSAESFRVGPYILQSVTPVGGGVF